MHKPVGCLLSLWERVRVRAFCFQTVYSNSGYALVGVFRWARFKKPERLSLTLLPIPVFGYNYGK